MEKRDFDEVWENVPQKIKIQNPAFEFVKKKNITRIISEFGNLSFRRFLTKVKKRKFD